MLEKVNSKLRPAVVHLKIYLHGGRVWLIHTKNNIIIANQVG